MILDGQIKLIGLFEITVKGGEFGVFLAGTEAAVPLSEIRDALQNGDVEPFRQQHPGVHFRHVVDEERLVYVVEYDRWREL